MTHHIHLGTWLAQRRVTQRSGALLLLKMVTYARENAMLLHSWVTTCVAPTSKSFNRAEGASLPATTATQDATRCATKTAFAPTVRYSLRIAECFARFALCSFCPLPFARFALCSLLCALCSPSPPPALLSSPPLISRAKVPEQHNAMPRRKRNALRCAIVF